jgi:shikimate kinase
LNRHGYASYLRSNSNLFCELLKSQTEPKLFALSSGFLVTDAEPDIALCNRMAVAKAGASILLLPSRDFNESLGIVLGRQLNRGLNLERAAEEQKFTSRFHGYLEFGGFQFFCSKPPMDAAQELAKQIASSAIY